MTPKNKQDKINEGKFIVIEGTDGSGKTTQIKLLAEYFRNQGIQTSLLDFPQYDKFWGKIAGRFFSGEFGELEDVNPYLIQPYLMLDQASQKDKIRKDLAAGKMVLSNRSITSSMAHQTSRMPKSQQDEFLEWLIEAGYTQLNMPQPDLVIVLYVQPEISIELAKKASGRKQAYTKGKKDIAEQNLTHQKQSAQKYLELCKKFDNWELINCINESGQIKNISDIHKTLIDLLKSL